MPLLMELIVVPYQEPVSKGDSPEFSSTLTSTMPMAAMFTRNKFVGWYVVLPDRAPIPADFPHDNDR